MTSKFISEAVSNISSQHIEEAADFKVKKKQPVWVKWGAVAACLCIVFAGVLFLKKPVSPNNEQPVVSIDENGVTIPPINISLSPNESADMITFFIYQGNCYVWYEYIYDNADIVGERLGTATGLIDEWTPQDGYVELAGSVNGDFYSVKGYDPSFMLCMKDDFGEVSTYVCNTGITLKYGSELYGDRLYLSENYHSLCYETHDSWDFSKAELFELDNCEIPAVVDFIDQLYQAEFIPWTTVVKQEGQTANSINDTEIYHVYFNMVNGMTVHLRLYENGYVRYQGLHDVCVQVPQDSFNAFINLLDSREGAAPIAE